MRSTARGESWSHQSFARFHSILSSAALPPFPFSPFILLKISSCEMFGWKATPAHARGVAACCNCTWQMLQNPQRWCFFLHIMKVKTPAVAIKKKNSVPRVQIKPESFARPWQAAADCVVHVLPCPPPSPPSQPSSAPVLKQSKQIKVLQGITSQNTARSAANMISANVRKSQGSGDLCGLWQQQELTFG